MLGAERKHLAGRALSRFVARRDGDAYHLYLRGLFQAEEAQVCELRMVRQDGSAFHARLEGAAVGAEGEPGGTAAGRRCRLAVSDVSRQAALEEALRRSEAVLAQAGRMAHLGAWEIEFDNYEDVNANPLRWSDEVYRIFGYQPGEVEPTNALFFERVHPDDRQSIADAVRQAIAEQRPYQIEHRVVRPDGSQRYVLEHAEFRFDPRGRPLRMIGAVQDITERKQAEAEIQTLARFPGENPNPVLRVTQDGRLLYANQASADLLACWNCSVGGRVPDTCRQVIPETLDAGLPREQEAACGERVISLVFAPIVDGGYVNIYGRDITERKRAEASLAEKAEELARSNKELELFAYVASHDLQEPLRMVASYVQLLAQRYQGRLDDKADRYIAYAVDGATRMKTLINDLLAYSRVGTHGKPLVPTDSQAILEIVLRNLQVAIEEQQVVVTHDPLPTVLADQVELGQVFQNLIGNGIKFRGDAPPRIHVGVQRDERGDIPSPAPPQVRVGQEWRFSVADNGIGLEPRFAERIFVIFQRLHNPTEYTGTGMGLAICKKIVERHGGRIWVESQPGQGATFYFTMPGV
jgi:PAS domain S-box-containing protein